MSAAPLPSPAPAEAIATRPRRWLPRSLATRLYLILISGLLIAHGLSFGMLFYERYLAANSMLMSNLEQDVGVAVNLLDRLPPEERAPWLPMLRRRTFHYALGEGQPGQPLTSETSREMAEMIATTLGPEYAVRADSVSTRPEIFQLHVRLMDGTPLLIVVQPSVMPIARWLPYVLVAQLGLLLLCTWAAVRFATRPLERLADAAENLSPDGRGERLREDGPSEVAHAAVAFNAMQDRIAGYTKDRLQILAAISHDLQTPITRLRLRVDSLEEGAPERERMNEDLLQMQQLVREGIAYARSAHAATEPAARVDLNALLDSLVLDYQDTGQAVSLRSQPLAPLTTRPHALRRVIANLVDNAIAYAGSAELELAQAGTHARILVRDRGPGIPDSELDKVMEPFYRLEASRNRDTGGTGLGLAIAQQLTESIGGQLHLRNREGGGLEASILLPQV